MLVAEELLGRVLTALLAGGGFAEVFVQRCTFAHVSLEDRKSVSANEGFFEGAGLRIIRDGLQLFACVSSLDEAELLESARELSGARGAGTRATFCEFAPLAPRNALPSAESPSELPLSSKTDLLLSAAEAAYEADGRVCGYSAFLKDSSGEVLVANSEGALASDTRTGTTLYQQVTVREDQGFRTGAQVLTTELTSDLLVTRSHEEDAREAVRSALARLEARSSPSGIFPVLFAPGAAGPLLHEAVGHALEGDVVLQGHSPYGNRMGQQVSAPVVTIGDGGPSPGRRSASECDDEGTPLRRALLVDRGVLKGFLTDRATALSLGFPLTGHARRESYRFPPMPRMRNLFVEPGTSKPEELLHSVEFGLYVARTSGGPVEAPGGAFEVEVTRGNVIREGRLAEPVYGATLVGTGVSFLEAIEAVGDDPGPSSGSCLKEGQTTAVCESVPTLRLSRLTVKGA